MHSMRGRIKLVVVCTVALTLLLALGLHEAGFGWGQNATARAALTAYLQQLPQAEAPAEPAVAGREATAEEAAALDKTVTSYLEAVRKRDFAAAWNLMANVPENLSREKWSEGLQELAGAELSSRPEMFLAILGGRPARLVDVRTAGEGGAAVVAVKYTGPYWLGLVQKNGAWMIDAEASENLQARENIGRQLQDLGSGTTDSFFRQMLMAEEGGEGPRSYLDLLLMSPQSAHHEISSRKIGDGKAGVRLQTEADIYLLIAVKRGPQGWALNLGDEIKVVPPGYELSADDAGRIAGASSPQRLACQSNLKQLSLAMMMYCQDYDERFAPTDKWNSALMPYTKNETILKCPVAEKYGYAMNYKLSRGYLGRVNEPATTIMLFDSSLLQPNAYDKGQMPGDSLPVPPRHEGLNNFAFSDGHVQALGFPPPPPYYRPYREGAPLPPLASGPAEPAAPAAGGGG